MKIKLRCVQSPICKNLKTPELNSSIPQLQRVLNVDAKKVKYKVLLLLPCERVLWCNLATHTEITIYLYIQSIVNHELSENCIMLKFSSLSLCLPLSQFFKNHPNTFCWCPTREQCFRLFHIFIPKWVFREAIKYLHIAWAQKLTLWARDTISIIFIIPYKTISKVLRN